MFFLNIPQAYDTKKQKKQSDWEDVMANVMATIDMHQASSSIIKHQPSAQLVELLLCHGGTPKSSSTHDQVMTWWLGSTDCPMVPWSLGGLEDDGGSFPCTTADVCTNVCTCFPCPRIEFFRDKEKTRWKDMERLEQTWDNRQFWAQWEHTKVIDMKVNTLLCDGKIATKTCTHIYIGGF